MTLPNSGQKLKPKLSGTSLPAEDFRLLECVGEPDPQGLLDVLLGVKPAMRVSDALDIKTCESIANNFNRICQKRGDEVPADRVGADHYGKTTNLYLTECASAAAVIEDLFDGVTNPVVTLKDKVGRILVQRYGMNLRAARNEGRVAADLRAMRFTGHGKQFALKPHEDQAQLRDPAQAGFEIQQVRYPVAVNHYLRVPQNGGGLRVWNFRPDDEFRRLLGLGFTGYPYPVEMLQGVESFVVHFKPGDCVFLSGAHIHAVEQTNGEERIILSFFMGLAALNECVCWT